MGVNKSNYFPEVVVVFRHTSLANKTTSSIFFLFRYFFYSGIFFTSVFFLLRYFFFWLFFFVKSRQATWVLFARVSQGRPYVELLSSSVTGSRD